MFLVPSTPAPRRAAAAAPPSIETALARAALASDRLRAGILCGFFAIFLTAYVLFFVFLPEIHAAVWHDRVRLGHLVGLFVPPVVFELLVCFLLSYSIRTDRPPPGATTFAVALAETSLPTFALLVLSQAMDPLLALTQPPANYYFLFILLSTLRLRPWLCAFTGAVAAAEYLALAAAFLPRDAAARPFAGLSAPALHLWRASLYFLAGAAAAFVASQVRAQAARALRSLEEEKRVRDVFGKHVSPEVVDQLLRRDVELGGEVRHVCVLFLDIRDFTARSARMKPEEVLTYLNRLFDFMIDSVNRHKGIVNKFLGDGFLAVFGAPVSDGRDSRNAVAAAREILKRVQALNAFEGGPPTRVGMGLHAGPVLAGTVGSTSRREYTIIGDTVNVASRIEALNKQFGSCLLVSEAVWREAGADAADAEVLGPVAVKGKDEPVPVYRLA